MQLSPAHQDQQGEIFSPNGLFDLSHSHENKHLLCLTALEQGAALIAALCMEVVLRLPPHTEVETNQYSLLSDTVH